MKIIKYCRLKREMSPSYLKTRCISPRGEKSNPSVWKFISLDPERLLSGIPIRDLVRIIEISEGDPDFGAIVSPGREPEVVQLVSMIIREMEARDQMESILLA